MTFKQVVGLFIEQVCETAYTLGLHSVNCLSHTMSNCSSRQCLDNVQEEVSGITGTKCVVD